MKIAFQMDPIGDVDINADSSFRLAEEAQARGHDLFYYSPDQLAYVEGRIVARGQDMRVQRCPKRQRCWSLRVRSTYRSSMSSGCVRIRRLTCITSPQPICWTT